MDFKVFEGSETAETEALARALTDARVKADEALDAGEYDEARAIVRSVMETLPRAARTVASPAVGIACGALGNTAYGVHDSRNAERLYGLWSMFEERAHPADHLMLQRARHRLALTTREMGNLAGARNLQQRVLEILERTLVDDDPELQTARGNLASTMREAGDLAGARRLETQVLAVFERTLPAGDSALLKARANLAGTLVALGDLTGARSLQEQVLVEHERARPVSDLGLHRARINLARTLLEMGDPVSARTLQEQALTLLERMPSADHSDPHVVREYLILAQGHLASTLRALGELPRARALEEQVLAALSVMLPQDHQWVQSARGNLAVTLSEMGDFAGARSLEEEVLAVFEGTLPPDHPNLQVARGNLAVTLREIGEHRAARALQETVLGCLEGRLHPHAQELQRARVNLAGTLLDIGESVKARALLEQSVAALERTLPTEHPNLQAARSHLASAMYEARDLAAARGLQEQVLACREQVLPPDHRRLQRARGNLARTRTRQRDRRGANEVTRSLVRGTLLGARADHGFSNRQWEAFSQDKEREFSWCLSVAAADPEALSIDEQFELVESLRCIGVARQRLERQLVVPAELRAELAGLDRAILERSWQLRTAALRTTRVDEGESAEGADAAQTFASLQRELERLQTERSARLVGVARAQGVAMETTVDAIGAALPEGAVAVGFWRYRRRSIDFEKGEIGPSQPSYVAFVVRKDAPAERVELGEAAAIEGALAAWHAAIGAPLLRGLGDEVDRVEPEAVAGAKLRELAFDPLRDALGDCRHVILALDSTLHLVPFGALPGSAEHGEEGILAESWKLEISTTLKELTSRPPKPLHPPQLVVFGGIDYDAEADPEPVPAVVASSDLVEAVDPGRANQAATSGDVADPAAGPIGADAVGQPEAQILDPRRLRGSRPYSNREFRPLFATENEANDVAGHFRRHFAAEGSEPEIRLGAAATRDALTRLAPRARFLHLATHAYYEDESILCVTDLRNQDDELRPFLSDRRDQVRGLSPMSICGVTLAGSNLRDPETGAPVGWFTAAELAELDLSGCELVVLSACGSHVGLERAGQGLASLQQAAFVAGARASLTSLWQVDDYATRDFMSQFYDRWWRRGLTIREALVATQKWMRDERDPGSGQPRYRTRDWAAWVLVGREGDGE